MEQLRYTIGLEFTYVNGTEGDEVTVQRIMRHVAAFRARPGPHETNLSLPGAYKWPQDVDALVESGYPLDKKGSDLWASDDLDLPDPPSRGPLMCAYGDSTLDPFSPQTPFYRLLTKERLACWHSHWRVIRSLADGQDSVALILEDDVDVELDIRQRLLGVWEALPSAWDIVFLGIGVIDCISCGVLLTATQVTVGLMSPNGPPSPTIIRRFQPSRCPSQHSAHRPHRSVHTRTHYREEGHDDWRYTFDILLLHTPGRLTRQSRGWWKAESSRVTR